MKWGHKKQQAKSLYGSFQLPAFPKAKSNHMHFSTSSLIFLVTVFLVRNVDAKNVIDALLCRPIVPVIEACKGPLRFRPFGFNIYK